MDFSLIKDFGRNKIYQGAAPDDDIKTIGQNAMLVEMAAGIDALHWVKQGSLKSVMYFGIEDLPSDCLEDSVLLALSHACSGWLITGGDLIFGCGAGVSRSSYADCATLMNYCRMTFDEAMAVIRNGRPQASPNPGFVAQLQRMQNTLMGV